MNIKATLVEKRIQKIVLLTVSGQVLNTIEFDAPLTAYSLDMEHLSTGFYFTHVVEEEAKVVSRFKVLKQ